MFDESPVSIIFRLINFAALIGLAVFIFKRYFLADITEKIHLEEVEKDTLRHQIGQLDQQGNILCHEIVEQEELCKKLAQKVSQWHQIFNHELEQARKENMVLRVKSAERAERQKKFIEHEQLMNAVFPQAIEQIQSQLIKEFSAADRNKTFVIDVIDHMKKSS